MGMATRRITLEEAMISSMTSSMLYLLRAVYKPTTPKTTITLPEMEEACTANTPINRTSTA